MAVSEQILDHTEIHPIDMVETLAANRDWDFDRIGDDQIAMVVEGAWRTYSITLAWSDYDETLRMICTFEMQPPQERHSALYETLNLTNEQCWSGGFSFWKDQGLMVYRYGLVLNGVMGASELQIERMLQTAVASSERFYPAFQLVCWGDEAPEAALSVAISEAYGRA